MRGRKFILCILAILLIAVPLFAACGGGDDDKGKNTSTTSAQKDEFPLEPKRFDTTIKILCVSSSRHRYGEVQFVADEEKTGNVINDAVAKRNDYIEEKYGLKIEVAPVQYPGDEIKLTIQSGIDEYQLVNDAVYKMLPNATENFYWSLEKYLKLDSPWWDQNAIENLTVTDKTYFVAGDALITDDDNTYLMLFNKEMYANNSELSGKYGDIYQLVRDGKWTYDRLAEMAKLVSQPDTNGDWGTEGGIYGLLGDNYGSGILVSGSGATSAEKTTDGGFRLTVGSERSVNAFAKVFEIMSDKSLTLRVEQLGDSGWGKVSNMFINKQGLFYMTAASSISSIKNSTAENIVDYGVLPIPKYDEEQEKYYNGINIYQSTVLAIPTTNVEKFDATVYLLEALGYYSKNFFGGESVAHAYYETTLKLQSVNSEDDEEMLDLIFSNRLYDIGAIYNWGGLLLDVYSRTLRSGSNTLVSYIDTIKDAVEADMEQTVARYKELAS